MTKLVHIAAKDLVETALKAVIIPILLQVYIGAGATIAYFIVMAVLYAVILKRDTLSTYVLIAGAGIIIGSAIVGITIIVLGAVTAALL